MGWRALGGPQKAIRALFVGVMLLGIAAVAPSGDFHPWVRVATELGVSEIHAGRSSTLLQSRIELSRSVVLSDAISHESRGQSDLDIFYRRHFVPAGTQLYVLGRDKSNEIVACASEYTYVSANIFTPEGRIDGPSCLIDLEADGRFDELWTGVWIEGTNLVRTQRLRGYDPTVNIDAGYTQAETTSIAYLEVAFAYDAAEDAILATLRDSNGVELDRDRWRVRSVRSTRTLEFFGTEIELQRVSDSTLTWRVLRSLRTDREFLLAYSGRRP